MKKRLLILFCLLLIFSCKSTQITKTEVAKLAESSKSWDGNNLPNYPTDAPKITILKYTIPPKTKLKIHKHLIINAGVLIKGELTVVDEFNNTLLLKEGDALIELVNTFHYGENKSNEPAEIIVFYAGDAETPLTVIKADSNIESNH
ncbi:cupin domain-containing protein [Thalassobellus sediminis]|uniref:cupin domain-containing protein n=1 Tax=Thalassobellus sediminis TaxID=3367753 RepID=UPI0037AFE406